MSLKRECEICGDEYRGEHECAPGEITSAIAVVNTTALREGWLLSDSDTYGLSLERDDDDPRFKDDDEAREHVERWAGEGSDIHILALALLEDAHNDDEPEDEPETSDCSACGGCAYLLGTLGNVQHFRCRDCGFDSHRG